MSAPLNMDLSCPAPQESSVATDSVYTITYSYSSELDDTGDGNAVSVADERGPVVLNAPPPPRSSPRSPRRTLAGTPKRPSRWHSLGLDDYLVDEAIAHQAVERSKGDLALPGETAASVRAKAPLYRTVRPFTRVPPCCSARAGELLARIAGAFLSNFWFELYITISSLALLLHLPIVLFTGVSGSKLLLLEWSFFAVGLLFVLEVIVRAVFERLYVSTLFIFMDVPALLAFAPVVALLSSSSASSSSSSSHSLSDLHMLFIFAAFRMARVARFFVSTRFLLRWALLLGQRAFCLRSKRLAELFSHALWLERNRGKGKSRAAYTLDILAVLACAIALGGYGGVYLCLTAKVVTRVPQFGAERLEAGFLTLDRSFYGAELAQFVAEMEHEGYPVMDVFFDGDLMWSVNAPARRQEVGFVRSQSGRTVARVLLTRLSARRGALLMSCYLLVTLTLVLGTIALSLYVHSLLVVVDALLLKFKQAATPGGGEAAPALDSPLLGLARNLELGESAANAGAVPSPSASSTGGDAWQPGESLSSDSRRANYSFAMDTIRHWDEHVQLGEQYADAVRASRRSLRGLQHDRLRLTLECDQRMRMLGSEALAPGPPANRYDEQRRSAYWAALASAHGRIVEPTPTLGLGVQDEACCTLFQLVDTLTSVEKSVTTDFFLALMMFYRRVASPLLLLELLVMRICTSSASESVELRVRNRVLHVIYFWVQHYFVDFLECPDALKLLQRTMDELLGDMAWPYAETLRQAVTAHLATPTLMSLGVPVKLSAREVALTPPPFSLALEPFSPGDQADQSTGTQSSDVARGNASAVGAGTLAAVGVSDADSYYQHQHDDGDDDDGDDDHDDHALLQAGRALMRVFPVELARQLTIANHQVYSCLQLAEFVDGAWLREDARARCPNLQRLQRHNQGIVSWLTGLLTCNGSRLANKHVVALASHLMKTSEALIELSCFAGARQIVEALNASRVLRTAALRSRLSVLGLTSFERVRALVAPGPGGSLEGYTQALLAARQRSTCSAVPIIDLVLTQLVDIDKELPDLLEGGLVNMCKAFALLQPTMLALHWCSLPPRLAELASVQAMLPVVPES